MLRLKSILREASYTEAYAIGYKKGKVVEPLRIGSEKKFKWVITLEDTAFSQKDYEKNFKHLIFSKVSDVYLIEDCRKRQPRTLKAFSFKTALSAAFRLQHNTKGDAALIKEIVEKAEQLFAQGCEL